VKIIVWGINYAPEQTGIAPYNTGLCTHLATAGHEVRMLTTFSYYPEWRKADDDRGQLYRTDTIDNVRVHRCWHYVPRRPNAWRRMIHEATFVVTSFLRLIFLPSPAVIVAISPPLLLGVAAWLASVLKRSRYVFHVQDMQPDAAVMLGLLKPGLLTRALYFLERLAHKHASVVSGITPGMLKLFAAKGVPRSHQLLFPNWMPEISVSLPEKGAFRRKNSIPPDAFLAAYSGNLGKKQGLDAILDLAQAMQSDQEKFRINSALRIIFVIAGDGVEKAALETKIARDKLHNVILLPLQSKPGYHQLLVDADVCLVTQQPGSGSLFFPSKLLTILAHGRPVVTVADPGGELEESVLTGGFGWSVAPGRTGQFADALREAAANPLEREKRGREGAAWVRQFSHENVLASFERELRRRFSELESTCQ